MIRPTILLIIIIIISIACDSNVKKDLAEYRELEERETLLPIDTIFRREIIYSSADYGMSWAPVLLGLPHDTKASFIVKKRNEFVL